MKLESKEKGRIIANVKFVMQGRKEVPYISPKGYSVIDIELLYHAIKRATLSDLEQFKKNRAHTVFGRIYRYFKKELDFSSSFLYVPHGTLYSCCHVINLSFPSSAILIHGLQAFFHSSVDALRSCQSHRYAY